MIGVVGSKVDCFAPLAMTGPDAKKSPVRLTPDGARRGAVD